MIFFFDRCIGLYVPTELRRRGVEVKIHGEVFKDDTEDDEWLAEVGSRGWVVVGKDYKFHLRANELAAIVQHKVGCFYLGTGHMMKEELLALFRKKYQDIYIAALRTTRPFIFKVPKAGSLAQIALPSVPQAIAEIASTAENPPGTC